MDIYQTIKERRSVRAYKSAPVDEKVLNRILEAARLAPSANNAQRHKFILVRDLEKRNALAKAGLYQKFISQAPIVIVAVALDPRLDEDSEIPFCAIDLAIALDHITLAAVSEGLGTCWIGAFSQKEVKKILNIPKKYQVIALMPLGLPDDKPRRKIRKSLSELICENEFLD